MRNFVTYILGSRNVSLSYHYVSDSNTYFSPGSGKATGVSHVACRMYFKSSQHALKQ